MEKGITGVAVGITWGLGLPLPREAHRNFATEMLFSGRRKEMCKRESCPNRTLTLQSIGLKHFKVDAVSIFTGKNPQFSKGEASNIITYFDVLILL